MFRANVFWSAFARAGMLVRAVYRPIAGPSRDVNVGFVSPDVAMLSGRIQSTEFEIEYQTADMPELRAGEAIEIDSATYKVRANPERKGDGFFSTVTLTKQ